MLTTDPGLIITLDQTQEIGYPLMIIPDLDMDRPRPSKVMVTQMQKLHCGP